jgi:hypothetical protein
MIKILQYIKTPNQRDQLCFDFVKDGILHYLQNGVPRSHSTVSSKFLDHVEIGDFNA